MSEKFIHKKSLGQHFLNSNYVPQKMCDAVGDIAGETVLEIGPGTGALTKEILARGAKVIALEADRRAIAALEENFAAAIKNGQLVIHHHDVRDFNPKQFGLENHSYIVIANIPYYLSGQIFRTLLETKTQPKTVVLLVQKEVAERIARDPKESLLSLSVKVFGDPTYVCTVKRGHFNPPPKVDSAILAIKNIGQHKLAAHQIDSDQFFSVIRPAFAQKRKQLIGNLSKEFPRTKLEKTFLELSLPLNIRAEDIDIKRWLKLINNLYTNDA